MKGLALFDFDGTITHKDAFLYFLKFSTKPHSLLVGLAILSPIIALYFAKIISNSRAKQKVFSWFFSGISIDDFKGMCDKFNSQIVPGMLKPEAMKKIRWHLENNHEVVVVTANFDLLLDKWCKENGLKLISTCLEVKNGKVTGRFSGLNCYGQEKVKRIREEFRIAEYQEVYAYGDTKGDMPMLKLAHFPFFRCF